MSEKVRLEDLFAHLSFVGQVELENNRGNNSERFIGGVYTLNLKYGTTVVPKMESGEFYYFVADRFKRLIPERFQNFGVMLDSKIRTREFWEKAWGEKSFVAKNKDGFISISLKEDK